MVTTRTITIREVRLTIQTTILICTSTAIVSSVMGGSIMEMMRLFPLPFTGMS
jgi:hypothetical protein